MPAFPRKKKKCPQYKIYTSSDVFFTNFSHILKYLAVKNCNCLEMIYLAFDKILTLNAFEYNSLRFKTHVSILCERKICKSIKQSVNFCEI